MKWQWVQCCVNYLCFSYSTHFLLPIFLSLLGKYVHFFVIFSCAPHEIWFLIYCCWIWTIYTRDLVFQYKNCTRGTSLLRIFNMLQIRYGFVTFQKFSWANITRCRNCFPLSFLQVLFFFRFTIRLRCKFQLPKIFFSKHNTLQELFSIAISARAHFTICLPCIITKWPLYSATVYNSGSNHSLLKSLEKISKCIHLKLTSY